MSEKTIGASGPSEGLIKKDSAAFASLVHNYNTNIIFSDEERDGSDRVMTQRCKDRLDTLAVLVTNRWSGLKLRVIEAWDSELRHEEGSLHYEGRAVDFTTSDGDISKYGILARMAVEAGFDWVYYTYEFHVHASVRADNSDSAKYGGCFPSNSSIVSESNGTVLISDVSVGDRILAADRGTGRLVYSDVILLMDNQADVLGRFIEISTKNRNVFLTPNHMLFAMNSVCASNNMLQAKSRNGDSTTWSRCAYPTYAEDIEAGQYIFAQDEAYVAARVTSVQEVTRRGLVAPLTRQGTIVVDGVIASCYSVFKHEPLAHAAFLPVRTFAFLMNKSDDTFGMHWYTQALSRVAKSIFPSSFFRLL